MGWLEEVAEHFSGRGPAPVAGRSPNLIIKGGFPPPFLHAVGEEELHGLLREIIGLVSEGETN